MAITLDAATEERIQRQLESGTFPGPTELLAHALDLLEEEKAAEDWLDRNMDTINADLEETFAQASRGECFSPEKSRALLAQHRATRDLNRLI
jgi:Arc/MetJ-type ribon-helix-helix transcriptional regulator